MKSISSRRRGWRGRVTAAAGCIIASAALTAPVATVGPAVLASPASAAAADPPWMNTALSPDERADLLLAQMTLEEKVDLMSSNQDEAPYAFYNAPIPRLGIPALKMQDSASGVHAHGWTTTNTGELATALPSAQALGATWSIDAITPYASTVADETRATAGNVLLSPVGDILRNPYWGRVNESPSEDPIMTANYLSQFTNVIQDKHVMATLKHYMAYTQETNRSRGSNTIVSNRALREVYALPYEAAVADSDPGSVMCSYNKINGEYSCENPQTLRGLLDSFGFTGYVATDYGASHTTLGMLRGGVDMETGTKDAYSGHLLDAARNGTVPESRLDESCRHILSAMFRTGMFDFPAERGPIDVAAGYRVARETQEKAITLLRNDRRTLPLTRTARKIAVIGADANHNAIGGGTPFVRAVRQTTPLQGILDRASDAGASVRWVQGNDPTNGANMLETSDMTAVPSSVLSPNNRVGNGLNAWFWKSDNFQGNPDEQRVARQVNYDVGILSTLDTPGPSQVPPPPVNCATCGGSAVYEGHITAPKTGAYTLSITGMGDATLDIDGQRVATMTGGEGTRAYAATPTLNWVAGEAHTIRITFKSVAFESLNSGTMLLQWKTPEDAYSPAIQRAVNAARNSDVAIVYANTIEGESHDRVSLKLPQSADQMIQAVSEVNPRTIVVLANAGPVTMPWLNEVEAVVETYYGGEAQGAALARVLWGDVNPSGKLTMTYPTSEDSLPPTVESPYGTADDVNVVYGEGVNVGYKGYEAAGITPLFEFGHGLSYTRYRYRNLTVRGGGTTSPIRVRFQVQNIGRRDGDEIAQVYLRLPRSTGEQKRLVGYSRVSTRAGRPTTVEVTIDPQASTHPLGYYDATSEAWTIAPGTYQVLVGPSSARTPLRGTFTIR